MSIEKITLQQYLQTYRIRKKVEKRKKSLSKNKGKDETGEKHPLYTQVSNKQLSILQILDRFLRNTKEDLQDIITNPELKLQEVFMFLLNTMEMLVVNLKKQISCTFKQIYWNYSFENDDPGLSIKDHPQYAATLSFFTQKFHQSRQLQQKKEYKQMLLKLQKCDQQNRQAAKLLINDFLNLTQNTQSQNPYQHNISYNTNSEQEPKVPIQVQNNSAKIVTDPKGIRKNTFLQQKSSKKLIKKGNNVQFINIQETQSGRLSNSGKNKMESTKVPPGKKEKNKQ